MTRNASCPLFGWQHLWKAAPESNATILVRVCACGARTEKRSGSAQRLRKTADARRRKRGDIALTETAGERVERILVRSVWNLGSLDGRLEAVNFHGNNPTFTIWDRVSGAPVRCSFPKLVWTERVKVLLEKRVRVSGKVTYFLNGIPRSISNIENIQDATPDPTLPAPEFGCLPDGAAAEDPVAFLRRVRTGGA